MKYKKISVNLISASIIVTSIFQSFPLNQVKAALKDDTAASTCVNSDMAALAFEQDDQVDSAQPSEILTGLTPDVDYKEGSVILMMKEGKGDARLGGVRGDLLSDAEELADVTRVVDEDEQLIEEMTGEEAALGSEDRVTLSLIESDEYTTAQLLDMYKDAPGVLEALPDYISHVDGEISESCADGFGEEPEDESAESYECEIIGGEDGSGLTEENEPVFLADSQTESVLGTDENTDLTFYQFFADDLPGGMDVPGWNDPANKNAEGTVVAVLDTGVDYEHPDLKSVMWDEGETYPALVAKGGGKYGYCALENEEKEDAYDSRDPMDDNGHGTHCAGIIGALWDEKGVSGLANGVRIMAVRVGDKNGSISDSTIIRGFEYIIEAAQAGVPVVGANCSFGGQQVNVYGKLMNDKAVSAGITVVWAAGNSAENLDLNRSSNGIFYNSPGLIIVDSCGVLGKKSGFSCYGIRGTDVFAPGEEILSTYLTKDPLRAASRFEDDAALFKDGTTRAFDDFEKEAVFFDPQFPDDSTMTARVIKEASIMGNPENHMLRIDIPASSTDENNRMILDLGDEFSESKPSVFYCHGNSAYGKLVVLKVSVPLKDGGEDTLEMNFANDLWYPRGIALPENTDYDNLKLTITADKSDVDRILYLDDAGMTSEVLRYAYLDGTSMATPAVTAAVAVAAFNFEAEHTLDRETAVLRAARVIGSVSANDLLKDHCRSGGVVKVSRLLDEKYIPVIESADNDKNSMTLSGYFFGDEEGFVSLDGEECKVLNWTDRAITVSMPFVPKGTEVKARVRSADDRCGMRYVALTPFEGNYMDRIPLNFVEDLSGYNLSMLFATGEAVYFSVKSTSDEQLWKYIPGKKKWIRLSDQESSLHGGNQAGYAVYGDYVLYSYNGAVCVYDRRQEKALGAIPFKELPQQKTTGMVNAGNNIFIFSSYDCDAQGNAVTLDKTVVYKLTPIKLGEGDVTMTKVGELSNRYEVPRVSADNDGNMYVTDGKAVEKVVFDPVKVQVTSTVLCEKLFEQETDSGSFDIAAVKDGILFFGDMQRGQEDRIENDVFLMKYDGTVTPCPISFATSPTCDNNVLAYRDKVYFLAVNRYAPDLFELGVTDMATNEANEDKSSGGEYDVPDVPVDNVDYMKLSIDSKTYYLSASVSAYYTAAKHVLYNSKSKGSHDLKLELKGFDPQKYEIKKISIKNSKKATHTPSGNLIVAEKKRACMIPQLKAAKGVKLTDEEKAHLKAVNNYFKKNPVYFSILQRDISDKALGSIETVYNKSGTKLKKLVYKPAKGDGFTLPKKDYTVELTDPENAGKGMTVIAKEGGNLWGKLIVK